MGISFKQCHRSNYKAGRTNTIEYIVIHYTANNGDTAANNANYFANNANLEASAHYFVDENEIYQSVEEKDIAWHCGATVYKHPNCRNANSLGVELCSRKDETGNYYFKAGTVTNAVELTKKLAKKYGIPIGNILRHYDVTGKNCPAPFVKSESAWEDFKNKIKENIDMSEVGNTPSEWAKEAVEKAVAKGIIKGDESGNLMLQNSVTREQLMVFFNRLGLLD